MGWHLSAAKHPTHTLAWGKIIERGKVRKLVGCDSLKRRERKEKSDAKEIIHHRPPVKQCPASLWAMTSLEINPPPLPPSPTPVFIVEHDCIWHGRSLGAIHIPYPSCVPSQPLALPCLVTVGEPWAKGKASRLHKHSQLSLNHWCVFSTLVATNPKHSTELPPSR